MCVCERCRQGLQHFAAVPTPSRPLFAQECPSAAQILELNADMDKTLMRSTLLSLVACALCWPRGASGTAKTFDESTRDLMGVQRWAGV